MRTCLLLLLIAFAVVPPAGAQTFDSPWFFSSYPYSQTVNTCGLQPQEMYFEELGEYFDGPAVVYEVPVLQNFLHPVKLKAREIYMFPETTDFSIWVCAQHDGVIVRGCVDASDNGMNAANWVQVPARVGVYYVIVAQGLQWPAPPCGRYDLAAYLLN